MLPAPEDDTKMDVPFGLLRGLDHDLVLVVWHHRHFKKTIANPRAGSSGCVTHTGMLEMCGATLAHRCARRCGVCCELEKGSFRVDDCGKEHYSLFLGCVEVCAAPFNSMRVCDFL